MRRHLGLSAALCALTLVAAGCSSGKNDEPQGEILIGVTIERSGGSALLGTAEANALNLTADEINRNGGVLGKRVKLVIRDNKSAPQESLKVVKDLVEKDKVVGIVGGGTTATTLPFLPYVTEKKIPAVVMGASETLVMPVAERKYIFKTTPNGTEIVKVMLQDFGQNNVRKIAMLAVDNQYGDNGAKALQVGTQRAGVKLLAIERYAENGKDFSTEVGRLVDTEPDAIVVSGIMPGAAIVAENLHKSGYKGRVYYDGGAGADLFVKDVGKASEGMFMVHASILAANQLTATTPSALAQKEFFIKYTQKFGTFSGYASYAADALTVMVEGIRKAEGTDGPQLRDAIESLSLDGLTGSYQFGPNNHGGASGDGLTMVTVRNGGWVLAQ
jgi:branched-chain amino acid transport system substrate-binding protein